MTQGRQPRSGTILGCNKSPEIPSLSNGVDAASPPLVVVGGIAFIGKHEAFLGRTPTSTLYACSLERCSFYGMEHFR
jgi:hypothetical protein